MKKILITSLSFLFVFYASILVNLAFAQSDVERVDSSTVLTAADSAGLNLRWWCLTWMWKNCFDYEKLVFPGSKIDSTNQHKSVLTIAQDVVLWATYMVWTVLTLVIIYCGMWYIFAARGAKDVSKWRKWLTNAAIWAVLVRWAYAIVRLIQYVAKW